MVQCRTCKDWYHQGAAACIHTDYAFDRDDFAEGEDYLCQTCLAAVPDLAFLHQYPTKPLTDRPAWQPHPPQTPATPATPASGLASPPPPPPPPRPPSHPPPLRSAPWWWRRVLLSPREGRGRRRESRSAAPSATGRPSPARPPASPRWSRARAGGRSRCWTRPRPRGPRRGRRTTGSPRRRRRGPKRSRRRRPAGRAAGRITPAVCRAGRRACGMRTGAL